MAVVSLHDVYSYIHRGMAIGEYENKYFEGFPVGGLKFLFSRLTASLGSGESIALFLDSPTDRGTIYPGYKSGRSNPDHRIGAQIRALEHMCEWAGIPIYKEPNMEADDLIASAAEKLAGPTSRVKIYSTDMDLAHSVDPYVSFETLSRDVNSVTWDNFSYAVEMGKRLFPNTLSAYKVFTGCKSDKIKPFVSEGSVKGEVFYRGFCKMLADIPNVIPSLTRHPKALRIFINGQGREMGLTDKDITDLEARIEVVYPRKSTIEDFKAKNRLDLDMDGYHRILSVTKDRESLKSQFLRKPHFAFMPEEDISYFHKMAADLRTGAFAADNKFSLDRKVEDFEELNLRSYF